MKRIGGLLSTIARFTGGEVKVKVKICDLDHLVERLAEAWAVIEQYAINATIKSFRKRAKACVDAEGKRFEYAL